MKPTDRDMMVLRISGGQRQFVGRTLNLLCIADQDFKNPTDGSLFGILLSVPRPDRRLAPYRLRFNITKFFLQSALNPDASIFRIFTSQIRDSDHDITYLEGCIEKKVAQAEFRATPLQPEFEYARHWPTRA